MVGSCRSRMCLFANIFHSGRNRRPMLNPTSRSPPSVYESAVLSGGRGSCMVWRRESSGGHVLRPTYGAARHRDLETGGLLGPHGSRPIHDWRSLGQHRFSIGRPVRRSVWRRVHSRAEAAIRGRMSVRSSVKLMPPEFRCRRTAVENSVRSSAQVPRVPVPGVRP